MAIVSASTSDITATSPTGVVVSPASVEKHPTLDQWNYKFPKLSELGDWQIKVAAAGFDKPIGTVLGTISVLEATQVLFAIPWNEAFNPKVQENTEAIATLQTDVGTLKTQLKANETADEAAQTALETKITDLAASVALLPTSATLDPIKTAIATLQTDTAALDKAKASAESVAALDTSIAAVKKSVEDLAALAPDVSQAELDSAIADYTAKLKTANDAIAAAQKSIADNAASVKTRVDAIETSLTTVKTTADEAATKTALQSLSGTVDQATVAIAAVKITADAAAKQTDLDTLETAVTENITAINDSAKALETELKAADTKLETDLKAADKLLSDRIDEIYYESIDPPNFDLKAWRFWHQINLSGSNWRSRLYYRSVKSNDALLMHDTSFSSLDEISPGLFQVEIEGGVVIKYESARNSSYIAQISFKAGEFTSSEIGYLDAGGALLRIGLNNSTIQPTQTAVGLGFVASAPANAVAGRIRLSRADRTFVEHTFQLT